MIDFIFKNSLFTEDEIKEMFKEVIKNISKYDEPPFLKFNPDIEQIESIGRKYKGNDLIVIGNGGSITTFQGCYKALYNGKNKVFVVNSMDPDLLVKVRSECDPENSVVVTISKSGKTIGIIESLLYFLNNGYKKLLVITTKQNNPLYNIAKRYNIETIEHPPLGGRYTGRSCVPYLPLSILGINIKEIDDGIEKAYGEYNFNMPYDENPVFKLATHLVALNRKGYDEIFLPIYSYRMFGFSNLIVQLIHESACKDGKGQTVLCVEAPESQHHTNQRFFGGKRNMLGLFIAVKESEKNNVVRVPEKLKDISLDGDSLKILDGTPYSRCLWYEYQGTYMDAIDRGIPCFSIIIDKITGFNVGKFIGAMHFLAVYISHLLGVNPYDQPDVERSKVISYDLRRKLKT